MTEQDAKASLLISATRKTRGKNTQEITFQAIPFVSIVEKDGKNEEVENWSGDKPKTVPENIIDAMMALCSQDTGLIWSIFATGYNEWAFEQVSDPIAQFFEENWNDAQKMAFRQIVNGFVKMFPDRSKADVAESVKASMSGNE